MDAEVCVDPVEARLARATDCPRLARLFDAYRQSMGRSPDGRAALAYIEERFRFGDSIIHVVENPSRVIVGFSQMYRSWSSLAGLPTMILSDLFVGTGARGRGYCRALLNAVQDYAAGSGIVEVQLPVVRADSGLRYLLDSRGWQPQQHTVAYRWQPGGGLG